jgi:hypothetical protein
MKQPSPVLAIATLASLLLGSTTAWASCEAFVAVGETNLGANGFEGTAETNLGTAEVQVGLLSMVALGSGALRAETSHTFGVAGLEFSTSDHAMLSPVNAFGLYRLNTQAQIDSGDATGQLSVDGLVDLANGWARWFASGRLCTF